jgi:hypothetical protein
MGQSAPTNHLPGSDSNQNLDIIQSRFQPADQPSPQPLNNKIITVIPQFQRLEPW